MRGCRVGRGHWAGGLIHGDMVIGDSRLMVGGGKSHGSVYSSVPVILVVGPTISSVTHHICVHTVHPNPVLNHVSFVYLSLAETKTGGKSHAH